IREWAGGLGLSEDAAQHAANTVTARFVPAIRDAGAALRDFDGRVGRVSMGWVTEENERAFGRHTQALRDNAREATYTADAIDEMGVIQREVTKFVDAAAGAQEDYLDSIKHTR